MVLKPSFVKIITTDFAAFLGMIFPPIFWIGFLVFWFSDSMQSVRSALLVILGAVSLFFLVLVFRRVNTIERVFEDGWETQAVITRIYFEKDRGRIEYTYKYGEVEYKSANGVLKNNQTKVLRVGDPVTVLVDRQKLKRAFLRDLYLSQPVADAAPVKKADEAGVCVPFQGEFDKQLFFKAVALAYRPSKWEMVWRVCAAVLIFALLFAAFSFGEKPPQLESYEWFRHILRPALTVLIGLAAVVQPFIDAPFAARKQWKDRSQQTMVVGEVDKQGISYTTSTGKTQFLPWSKFIKIKLDHQMIVMVTAEGAVHALPRSFFQTDGQWLISAVLAKGYVRPAVYA